MIYRKYLHFTLGPVQSFVGQARRTRDYWAGSFILAYLAGQAIDAVQEREGKVIFPARKIGKEEDDPLLLAIKKVKKRGSIEDGPHIATLPNRFMAQVPPEFDPTICTQAINKAWSKIAATVRDKALEEMIDKERRKRLAAKERKRELAEMSPLGREMEESGYNTNPHQFIETMGEIWIPRLEDESLSQAERKEIAGYLAKWYQENRPGQWRKQKRHTRARKRISLIKSILKE